MKGHARPRPAPTLTEGMNGQVGVDSVQGLGATFWLERPPA
jgi:hypothetical protein